MKTELAFIISNKGRIGSKLNSELSDGLNDLVLNQSDEEELKDDLFLSVFQTGVEPVEMVPEAAGLNIQIVNRRRTVPKEPSIFDLVATSIASIQSRHEKGDQVICVILSGEPSLRANSHRGVASSVASLESKNWTFLHACFDPNGPEDGKAMGVSPEKIRFFPPTQRGVAEMIKVLGDGIKKIRQGQARTLTFY